MPILIKSFTANSNAEKSGVAKACAGGPTSSPLPLKKSPTGPNKSPPGGVLVRGFSCEENVLGGLLWGGTSVGGLRWVIFCQRFCVKCRPET